ncbi:MAG: hypothetical protein KF795_19270 [Labilithrix sp.]|nr:hypothetical protein [Labilithrix sp.]
MSRIRHLLGTVWTAVGVALVAACGDVYADPDPDLAAPAFDAGATEAGVFFPGDMRPDCPATRPRENSTCPIVGTTCEYGTSADRQCNTVLVCEGSMLGGGWAARPNDSCFAAVCPSGAEVATLDGKPCALDADGGPVTDNDEAVCNMTDGTCACTTGRDGATRHDRRWVCVRPVSDCPPSRPRQGEPCNGGLWCDYGSCTSKRGAVMECTSGVWLTGGAPCP